MLTTQRRLIFQVISEATDHPGIVELHRRVTAVNKRVSRATIYKLLRRLESAGIVERHTFRGHRPRYELATNPHHGHLIDIRNGTVLDFRNQQIERALGKIARHLGFRPVAHRLDLYAVPICASDRDR